MGTDTHESIVVLAIGITVIALIGIAAIRGTQSAMLRRSVWRTAVATGLALFALEVVGIGRGVSDWWSIANSTGKPTANLPVLQQSQGPPDPAPSPEFTGYSGNRSQEFGDPDDTRRSLGTSGSIIFTANDFEERGQGPSAVGSRAYDSSNLNRRTRAPIQIRNTALRPVDTVPDNRVPDMSVWETEATRSKMQKDDDTGANVSVAGDSAGVSAGDSAGVSAGLRPPLAVGWPAAEWVVPVWLIGGVIVFAAFAAGQLALVLYRVCHLQPAPGEVVRMARRLSRAIGVRQAVEILQGPGLRSPVAFGVFRPTIAVPNGFADEFEVAAREAILAHELTHLAARDPLWQLAADLVTTFLWWHPCLWWIRRQLRKETEAAADEGCLAVPDGPNALASALVTLGKNMNTPDRLAWFSVTGFSVTGGTMRSSLAKRVARLIKLERKLGDMSTTNRGKTQTSACRMGFLLQMAIPMVLVSGILVGSAWARPVSTTNRGETTMNVLKMSWKKSLAAAALAAILTGDAPATAADDPSDELAADQTIEIDLSDETQPVGADEEDEGIEARERELREAFEDLEQETRGLHRKHDRERERAAKLLHILRDRLEETKGNSEGAAAVREILYSALLQRHRELKEVERHAHQQTRELEHRRHELENGKMELRRHQIENKAARLERHAEELQFKLEDSKGRWGHGHPDTRLLQKQLERIHEHHRALEAEHRELERAAKHRELDHLRDETKLHRERGQLEQARNFARAAERLARHTGRRDEGRIRSHRGDGDLHRRLEHLRAAAENLAAAGMHDEAGDLMRHAEEMAHEHEEHPGERHSEERRHENENELHESHGDDRIEALEEEIGNLHEQIGELNDHLEEMHDRLNDILEHLEADEFDEEDEDGDEDDEDDSSLLR